MAKCLENCKWMCIISYILASLGSIVLWMQRDFKKFQNFNKWLIRLYALAAVITLGCSVRWALANDVPKIKF